MTQTAFFTDMTQCTDAEVQRLLPLVSPQRREAALRFKHLKGRYACLKSYELLSQLLAEHYGIATGTPLTFDFGPHGKPTLRDFPHIHFNLSHCPNAIAVAVDDAPVGIDVERFITPKDDLLHYVMNDDEAGIVSQSPHPDREFARLWTRKEALYKQTGTGIHGNIRDILTAPPADVLLESAIDPQHAMAYTIARRRTVEVVAAVIRRGDTLLATRRGYGPWAGWWEFPGGKPETGESHIEALCRELHEELDATVLIDRLLTTVHYDYPEFHLVMHCYLCTLPDGHFTLREHADARWVAAVDLDDLKWLPADLQLLPQLRALLSSAE